MIGRIRIVLGLAYVVLSSLVLVPLQMLSMRTGWFREAVILKIWHGTIVRALGIRIHVRGSMAGDRPLLIASNHVSWTDIIVLGSRYDVTFIAKSELAGWPVLGMLAGLQRTVFVERERRRKSGEQAGEVARRLAGGSAMVLFAEGTTGDGNLLLPFKSTLFGAASMAVAQGAADAVMVQPLAIAYTRTHGLPMGRRHRFAASWIGDTELWPHIKALLREGAMDVELHFGEAMPFTAAANRKDVTRRAERQVNEMLVASLRDPMPR